MSKDLHFLLDMDGVLCDFFTAALDLLNERLGRSVQHADLDGESNLETIFDIPKSFFWRLIESDPNFWINLNPFPWAADLYNGLKVIGEVTISSSPSRDPRCHAQKIEWLSRHLGIHAGDVMLGSKKYLMARPNHILIDDFEHNVNAFRSHGGQAILVPSNWNRKVPNAVDVHLAVGAGIEDSLNRMVNG